MARSRLGGFLKLGRSLRREITAAATQRHGRCHSSDAADRVVVGGHWHGSGPRPGKEPEVPGVVTGLGLRKGHGSDAQL